jgi:hypothetical protein
MKTCLADWSTQSKGVVQVFSELDRRICGNGHQEGRPVGPKPASWARFFGAEGGHGCLRRLWGAKVVAQLGGESSSRHALNSDRHPVKKLL